MGERIGERPVGLLGRARPVAAELARERPHAQDRLGEGDRGLRYRLHISPDKLKLVLSVSRERQWRHVSRIMQDDKRSSRECPGKLAVGVEC